MGYSGSSGSSYSSNGNGISGYTRYYTTSDGSFTTSTTDGKINGREVYIERRVDNRYGGSQTTTYDRASGTKTYHTEGYSGK